MNKNEEENMRIYREQNNKINLFQQKDYNDVSYWMLDNLIFPAKTQTPVHTRWSDQKRWFCSRSLRSSSRTESSHLLK